MTEELVPVELRFDAQFQFDEFTKSRKAATPRASLGTALSVSISISPAQSNEFELPLDIFTDVGYGTKGNCFAEAAA